ncbi:MAG: DUF1016 family protein [Erysipelotrichia bacterium]|nr:DUF1016 family protein [Erysipelotrichia bacterium]
MIRKFYLTYAKDQISQTVFDQFKNLPKTDNGRQFYLSWSHYLQLMRISNVNERHFYEIEAETTTQETTTPANQVNDKKVETGDSSHTNELWLLLGFSLIVIGKVTLRKKLAK